MSIESARAFIDRVTTDEEFAKKVHACKDVDDRFAFLKAEGFDFTTEEISTFQNQELTDADLDMIAGGKGGGWFSDFWGGVKTEYHWANDEPCDDAFERWGTIIGGWF